MQIGNMKANRCKGIATQLKQTAQSSSASEDECLATCMPFEENQ
jgi:hypothetical protein